MKKILTLAMILAISTSTVLAATTSYKTDFKNAATNVKNSVKDSYEQTKTNIKNENNAVKQGVKQDLQKRQEEKNAQATAKKEEKIKQIDIKLNELSAELKRVKADKTISETQRSLKINSLQRQIEFQNKQKAALK